MSIEKKFLKTKPVCKVKFSLSGEPYTTASTIHLLGDFNDWQPGEMPFKKSKLGDWSLTIDLPAGNSYEFRYLVDETKWMTDHEADRLTPNNSGSENGVLEL